MSQNCIKLDHPSCLYVLPVCSCNESCLEFRLPFFPKRVLGQGNKCGRVFVIQRPATDMFSSFATRLVESINEHFNQSRRNSQHAPSVACLQATDITLDCGQSGPSESLGDIFATPKPMQIRLHINTESPKVVVFDVRINPACITSVKLDLIPFIGCPICPAIVGENLDLENSKFEWSVSKNKAETKADSKWKKGQIVHKGFYFNPQPEHLGHFVRLRVLPYDAERLPGVPFGEPDLCDKSNNTGPLPFFGQFVVCARPITEAPPQTLIRDRCRTVANHAKAANEFRLISYNLLAYMYSTAKGASTYFFRHCPPVYLEPEYRFPLIYRELLAYRADILCLQEVDTGHFQRRLSFLLRQAGDFEGCFHSKLLIEVPTDLQSLTQAQPTASYPRKEEGTAIFFRRERFRLVKKVALDSLILHAESNYPDLARTYHEVAESCEIPLYLCMRSRAHGVLVCLLECQHTGQRILVANTHLYFQPQALILRKIQSLALRRFLFKLSQDLAEKDPLPVILAADLNTEPDSEPYQCLTGALGDLGASESALEAAVPLPEGVFTNIVPGFKAKLDAVLYSSPHQRHEKPLGPLRVAHAFPVPSEAEVLADGRNAHPTFPSLLPEAAGGFTLPNSEFPSDHLALAVDFSITEV